MSGNSLVGWGEMLVGCVLRWGGVRCWWGVSPVGWGEDAGGVWSPVGWGEVVGRIEVAVVSPRLVRSLMHSRVCRTHK